MKTHGFEVKSAPVRPVRRKKEIVTKPPATGASRVAAHRAKLREQGGARISVELTPAAAKALEERAKAAGMTRAAYINWLLTR